MTCILSILKECMYIFSKRSEMRKHLQKSTKFTKAVKSLGLLGIRLLVGSDEGMNPELTSLCPWRKKKKKREKKKGHVRHTRSLRLLSTVVYIQKRGFTILKHLLKKKHTRQQPFVKFVETNVYFDSTSSSVFTFCKERSSFSTIFMTDCTSASYRSMFRAFRL